MDNAQVKINHLTTDLIKTKEFLFRNLKEKKSPIHIYTHLDADGLASGAILGKALYREKIPFQISVLRQLERKEILKIKDLLHEFECFLIFSDFGSGQYLELLEQLKLGDELSPFLIFDHHLPQNISNKNSDLTKLYEETRPWHINPYFYNIDGSNEISGAGLCYFFAKTLNKVNKDLSPIALIGATGDIQNQGPKKTFFGLNSFILEDAKKLKLIDIVNDLNFPPLKPLHEAIAYATDINLPSLSREPNKVLIFLQKLGILMENTDGNIKTLNDLNQKEKQKVTSAIIQYATIKMNLNPNEIIDKLIINRYVLINEIQGSELQDLQEFSNLLNSCGRTNNGALGIAVAMGDRKNALKSAQENLISYKKSIFEALSWIYDKNVIQIKENIQFFFGEDVISATIIGTICSMLILEKSDLIDSAKPLFGLAKREDEDVFKVSSRANEDLVNQGLNLSEIIRDALELSDLKTLGGGHPSAAGTKIPIDQAELFLKNCDKLVKKQLGR